MAQTRRRGADSETRRRLGDATDSEKRRRLGEEAQTRRRDADWEKRRRLGEEAQTRRRRRLGDATDPEKRSRLGEGADSEMVQTRGSAIAESSPYLSLHPFSESALCSCQRLLRVCAISESAPEMTRRGHLRRRHFRRRAQTRRIGAGSEKRHKLG